MEPWEEASKLNFNYIEFFYANNAMQIALHIKTDTSVPKLRT